jgi:hypothetical protein
MQHSASTNSVRVVLYCDVSSLCPSAVLCICWVGWLFGLSVCPVAYGRAVRTLACIIALRLSRGVRNCTLTWFIVWVRKLSFFVGESCGHQSGGWKVGRNVGGYCRGRLCSFNHYRLWRCLVITAQISLW